MKHAPTIWQCHCKIVGRFYDYCNFIRDKCNLTLQAQITGFFICWHTVLSYIFRFFFIQDSKQAIMHHETEWPRKYFTVFILTLGLWQCDHCVYLVYQFMIFTWYFHITNYRLYLNFLSVKLLIRYANNLSLSVWILSTICRLVTTEWFGTNTFHLLIIPKAKILITTSFFWERLKCKAWAFLILILRLGLW